MYLAFFLVYAVSHGGQLFSRARREPRTSLSHCRLKVRMKQPLQPPLWLPSALHLAHGLIAGGAGYMLARAAVLYNYAEPGSPRATGALLAIVLLTLFEVGYVAFLLARRSKVRRLWREADAAMRNGKFEAAEFLLVQLLRFTDYRIGPQPVLFALGSAKEGMGQDREAAVLYRRCGDYPPALTALALLQLRRGHNLRAAEALRKLLARRPGETAGTVLLAVALFRNGSGEAAARVLRRALEQRPKSEMLRQNLSRVESGTEPSLLIERPQAASLPAGQPGVAQARTPV